MIIIKPTHSDIIILFLVASSSLLHVTDAQSSTQPVAPPALQDNVNPSLTVMLVILVIAVLVISFCSFCLGHCSEAYPVPGNPIGANCSYPHQGIDPEVLATFPIIVYSTVKMGNAVLQCAVCLSEFREHDTLRLLPKCSHVFHPDCIDAWLASHVTCPVCRAKLKPECGEIKVVIGNERNEHRVFDESSVRRAGVSAAEEPPPVVGNVDGCVGKESGSSKLGTFGMLVRSHSTGHCLVEPGKGKSMERYTLRLAEEVRMQIVDEHGSMMRRSASYDVILQREGCSRKGWWWCRSEGEGGGGGEGSSKGMKDGVDQRENSWWVLSMTPPFVSRGWGSLGAAQNASTTCSGIPRFWASSSCPPHPL